MPADTVWICHQCGQQVIPHDFDGYKVCPRCGSDFLEQIDMVDDEQDGLPDELVRNMHEYGLSDDDEYESLPHPPGAFPSTPASPTASGSATPPLTQRQRTQPPLFRMGVRGGSLTFGGGGGTPTDGRRAGRGAGFASPEPMLRTSYQEGVPTLSEFIAGLGAPARARSPRSPAQPDPFAGLFPPRSNFDNRPRALRGERQVDLGDVISGLLGAFAGPSRGGGGGADDPYMALLRAQGGLGAFLGGGMLRGGGQFGDFATSQEAFDHIVTNLAQAAGTSSDRPPPASAHAIDALPSVPISSVLLDGLDPKECPICMSEFEAGETGRKMPCLHFFHDGCLRTWLETNGTCPVCRYSLVDPRPGDPSSGAPAPPARSSSSVSSSSAPPSDAPPASSPSADAGASGSSTAHERREPPVRRSGAAAGTGVRAEDE